MFRRSPVRRIASQVYRKAQFPVFGLGAQFGRLGFRQDHRQQAVLRAIGPEDFAETGSR